MDEKPKSIWKKSWSWKGWRGFILYSLLFSGAVFGIIFLIGWVAGTKDDTVPLAAGFALGTFLIVSCVSCIRWFFGWVNRKRFLCVATSVVALIALFYGEEAWRGRHAWNKFKHEWEAKGEKFDFKDFVPSPVPDDQNFAMAPIFDATDKLLDWKWREQHRNPRHSTYSKEGGLVIDESEKEWDTNLVDRLAMNIYGTRGYMEWQTNATGNWAKGTASNLKFWQDYYRATNSDTDAQIFTNEFPVSPQPQSPAADVLLALSKYDSAIEELRQASQRPYSRFPLSYDEDNKSEIWLNHLAGLKQCAQVLQLRAIAELQNGQSEKAFADVQLSFYLVNSIRTEPFLISHLVRIAILQIAFQPVYEGLAEHKWSDAQLVELNRELANFNFLADYKSAVRSETGIRDDITEYLPCHPEQFFTSDDNVQSLSFLQRFTWSLIPRGWFYQNRLNYARAMTEYYLPLVDEKKQTVFPAQARRADAALVADSRSWMPYNILEWMWFPAVGAAERKFAYAQESADLARAAVALERYRLAHGEFPESLDALAPQLMVKIPHDIISGQPLHYRHMDDGQFILYSVGWNETDDGGVVSFVKDYQRVEIREGDWVWRYQRKE